MVETTAALAQAPRAGMAGGLTLPMAWRNLWRNTRRTWLTAGAIAFASGLVSFFMALQAGTYGHLVEIATGMYAGNAQVSRRDFIDDGKLEQSIEEVTTLKRQIEAVGGVSVYPRLQGFSLVSVGERSYGGLLMGVEIAREATEFGIYDTLTQGALPVASDEVVIGETLARNLGATVGEEIVILGTAKEGGVAALALTVSGLFNTGQPDFDRTFLLTHLTTVQQGFEFGDEAHTLVLDYASKEDINRRTREIDALMPAGIVARSWEAIMPEVVEAIELDRIGGVFMNSVILILVTFGVVNTFLMIVYERTREFGMLLALGMRPWMIVRQVQLEAALIWVVGAGLGIGCILVLTAILSQVGIPIGGITEQMKIGIGVPDRIFPAFAASAFLIAPIVLLVGTQVAAFVAVVRVNWLQPVAALRSE